MARHHIPVNDLHAYLSKQLAPLKARIPDVFALPKSFLFHEPMLETIKPQLGKQ